LRPLLSYFIQKTQTPNFLHSPPILSKFASQTPFALLSSFFSVSAAWGTSSEQRPPAEVAKPPVGKQWRALAGA
uniref:Uncharacterized protein n=1 Tax=Solanum lycopersicum TaxID=4081 RepID=A0A3Q7ECG2_SOLLC